MVSWQKQLLFDTQPYIERFCQLFHFHGSYVCDLMHKVQSMAVFVKIIFIVLWQRRKVKYWKSCDVEVESLKTQLHKSAALLDV